MSARESLYAIWLRSQPGYVPPPPRPSGFVEAELDPESEALYQEILREEAETALANHYRTAADAREGLAAGLLRYAKWLSWRFHTEQEEFEGVALFALTKFLNDRLGNEERFSRYWNWSVSYMLLQARDAMRTACRRYLRSYRRGAACQDGEDMQRHPPLRAEELRQLIDPPRGKAEDTAEDYRSRDPAEAMEAADVVAIVRGAVEALPAHLRHVIRLHMDGLSDSDVGEQLGIPRSTVAHRRKQAEKALREKLKNLADGVGR